MRLSSRARLWKKLDRDRSCGVHTASPEAMRSRDSLTIGAMTSTVRWNRSVAVSVAPTGTARCINMSPMSRSASMRWAVTPTCFSPLMSAQMIGEKPA